MTTQFVKPKAVRDYALHLSATTRLGKFTRVRSSFIERIDQKVRRSIEWEVHSHPSTGKTLL